MKLRVLAVALLVICDIALALPEPVHAAQTAERAELPPHRVGGPATLEDRIAPNPIAGDAILAGKLAIGLGCALALLWLLRQSWFFGMRQREFDWLVLALCLASRGGLFLVLYVVFDFHLTGDVPRYYDEGVWVGEGQIPNRDFLTSYGPLFPYAIRSITALWDAQQAIVLAAIAIELATLPFWLRVGRRFFGERVARVAAALYVLSPIVLLNVAMNGQNQIWVGLPLALSLLLLQQRDLASGAAHALSLVAVKALSLVFAPVLWLFAQARAAWALGFATVVGSVYVGWYALAGAQVLAGLRFESGRYTSGNLYYLASGAGLPLEHPTMAWIAPALLISALATVFLGAWARGVRVVPRNAVHLCTLVLLTLLLFALKSYTFYLVMGFYCVCLSVANSELGTRGQIGFALFGTLAALEPGMHSRWLLQGPLHLLWSPDLPNEVVRAKTVVFALCEIGLVAAYVGVFARTWAQLPSSGGPESSAVA